MEVPTLGFVKSMGGGGMVEIVEVYLPNQYTRHPKIEPKSSKNVNSEIYKGKIAKNQQATHFQWPPNEAPTS